MAQLEQLKTEQSLSIDQIQGFFDNKIKEYKDKQPPSQLKKPNNVLILDKDSRKYSFEKDDANSIYKDKQLIETAKAFYLLRDGLKFKNDEAIVRKYVTDRTWKQANTGSIGKELIYATSESIDPDQKARLAYLVEYWNNLPHFWQDGGRGWVEGIGSNLWRGVLDPTNLIGPVVAKATIGTLISAAAKKGTQVALKNVLWKGVGVGTGSQFAADMVIGASVDAAIQATEKELLLRNRFDKKRMFTSAMMFGGIGIFPGLPYTYGVAKAYTKSAELNLTTKNLAQKIFDFAHPAKDLNHKIYGVKSNIEGYKAKGKEIDKLLKNFISKEPDHPLAKKINAYFKADNDKLGVAAGLKLSKKEVALLKEISIGDSKVVNPSKVNYLDLRDPGDYGYIHLRELASSLTRAESAIHADGAVVLPVTANRTKVGLDKEIVVKGGYEKTNATPLLRIYEPLSDAKLIKTFNDYVQARRSQVYNRAGVTTTMKPPEIKKAIHAFKIAKQKGNNKTILNTALTELKLYTRTLLELNKRVGIISDAEYNKILKSNPIYAPFYARTKESTIANLKRPDTVARITDIGQPKIVEGKPTITTAGVKTPAKLELTGSDVAIKPLHESLMSYTFHTYQAAEKNLAKLRLYSEINDAVTMGVLKKGEIVKRLSHVEFTDAIKKSVVTALQAEADSLGLKFSKKLSTGLLEGEDAIKVAAFKNNIKLKDGRIIDLAYENGKLKAYEIIDPAYVELFKTLGGVSSHYVGKLSNFLDGLIKGTGTSVSKSAKFGKRVREVSRWFPNLITHSPPFIAFNGIRDTLTGSINSAFGFNALGFFPGFSTARGLFATFKPAKEILSELIGMVNPSHVLWKRPKHPNFLQLTRGMKNAFGASRIYQKGLLAGGGFASRRDSELLVKNITRQIKNADIPAKDRKVYLDSFNWLNSIGYYGENFFKAYGQIVNRVEYSSRLGEFMLAKKAGMSDRVAGFAMREISTDFGMHGSSVALNAYNRVTMFFNAGLQGFYRGIIRRPIENPGKFATGVIATIVAPELMLWALNNETPEYEEISDDIKLLHYMIPIYMEDKVDGSHLRTLEDGSVQRKIERFFLIPKPYDFGAFANIAVGILEAIQEGAPEIAIEYAYLSLAKVFPGLTKPTLISPVIDLALNKNYKDKAIIPYYTAKSMYKDSLVNSNTRVSSVAIARVLNDWYQTLPHVTDPEEGWANPLVIDYLITNYFVGLAAYAPDIVEAEYAWDDESYGARPKGRIDENDITNNIFSIVTRRFTAKTTPTRFSKNLSLIFELKKIASKKLGNVDSSAKDLSETLREKGIDINKMTRQEVSDALQAFPILDAAVTSIQGIDEQMKVVKFSKYQADGSLHTSESKRIKIDELRTIRNKLAYNVFNNIRDFQDPTFLISTFGTKLYKEYTKKNLRTRPFQKWFAKMQTKLFD